MRVKWIKLRVKWIKTRLKRIIIRVKWIKMRVKWIKMKLKFSQNKVKLIKMRVKWDKNGGKITQNEDKYGLLIWGNMNLWEIWNNTNYYTMLLRIQAVAPTTRKEFRKGNHDLSKKQKVNIKVSTVLLSFQLKWKSRRRHEPKVKKERIR